MSLNPVPDQRHPCFHSANTPVKQLNLKTFGTRRFVRTTDATIPMNLEARRVGRQSVRDIEPNTSGHKIQAF